MVSRVPCAIAASREQRVTGGVCVALRRDEFIELFRETLEWPAASFNEETVLEGHEKWDSVGILSTIVLADERLKVVLSAEALQRATTVKDVLSLISPALQ